MKKKNDGLDQLRKAREKTIKRWKKAGLLDGLNGDISVNCAELFQGKLSYTVPSEIKQHKDREHDRRFKTYEKAKKFLELRRRHAYRRIELNGDVVLRDNSFAGQSWNGDGTYIAFLVIWTKNMIEDISNLQTPDIYESNYSGK